MTTDQAIAEICARTPAWAGRFVDVPSVARRALDHLAQPREGATWGNREVRPVAGWFARRRLKKETIQAIKSDCQPKAGCAFVLLSMSGLFLLIVEFAIGAVVESCVEWWMEHRVLPQG